MPYHGLIWVSMGTIVFSKTKPGHLAVFFWLRPDRFRDRQVSTGIRPDYGSSRMCLNFVLTMFFLRTDKTKKRSRPLAPDSERKGQAACKPGSVPACAGDGHSSGTPVTGRLVRPTRAIARKRASDPKARIAPTRSCSRWGLPCHVRYRTRGALLPHPFTLTDRR